MKFGKSLSSQIEDALPEWKDKFLSYKHLKKRLKLIRSAASPPAKRPRVDEVDADSVESVMTREEEDFISLLEAELDKFNAFFLEKEEEYIIRQKVPNYFLSIFIFSSFFSCRKSQKGHLLDDYLFFFFFFLGAI